MTRSTPMIHDTTLVFYEEEQAISIIVESAQWFAWLQEETSTTFAFHSPHGSYTARKERVGNHRGGWYWKAYRKYQGTLYRAYLGKPENLTLARLNEIVFTLSTQRSEESSTQKVPEAVKNLHHRIHDDTNTIPLLETRLHPPQLSVGLVERTRLLVRLDTSFTHKLTLVQAPSGFGKTTLVSQWLTTHSTPPALAWVSLETGDNDPLRFWRTVMTACQMLLGQEQRASGQAALALLTTTIHPPFEPSPIEKALTRLLNDLAAHSSEGLLILDDYHVITEPRIHKQLAFFIDHLPKKIHMLLLSRAEPDLPLLRWRAKGSMYELHGTDLRFSSEETAAFLRQALPITLSEGAFTQLEKSLEGWATGLRLLCLTLSRWRTSQAIEQALLSLDKRTGGSTPHRPLLDYFVAEILEAQPEPIQHFLLHTSVLSRLCGPLCDAITGSQNSVAQLEAMEKAGLFVEALEGPGEWYRYHALFAEAMRREASRHLGEEVLSTLSSHSSSWYEQQGMLAEAIEAALLAHDVERIARLIEQVATQEPLYEPQTLLRWLEAIPEALLRERPMLCFISATAYQAAQEARPLLEGRSSSAGEISRIEMLFQLAEEGWRRLGYLPWLGVILASRAISTLEHGSFSLALEYAQQALTLLPKIDLDIRMQLWHSACLLMVGMERLLAGFLGEARPLILDALKRGQTLPSYDYLIHQILLTLGRSHLLAGEFHQAHDMYHQVLSEARAQENHELTADALLALAWLEFEWNDLAAVEQQVQEAAEHIRFARHQRQELHEHATFLRALLQQAQGQTTEALTQLTAQLTRIQSSLTSGVLEFLPFVVDWQRRLLLATSALETVEQHVKSRTLEQEQSPFLQYLVNQILAGRLLLAQGQAKAALFQFEQLLSEARVQHHQYYVLQIRLLLALAHDASKQNQQAQHHLRSVLIMARSEDFLRLFLNEGEPLARLLRSLLPTIKENTLRSYVQTILQAFTQNAGSSFPTTLPDSLLFEPLSVQEQRVLRLLAAGYTNKEIASELIVSVNTVKDHVKHLYRKLGVNNRLQASSASQLLKLD
ncbi:MAG TPA: LuxR C-terminal-related transcriptional regulator [Ktedonobacteraceae bacterium]